MQYQTPNSAGNVGHADNAGRANHANHGAPAGSVLMSSAWVRLVGASALIGVLWLAVAWALAGVGG